MTNNLRIIIFDTSQNSANHISELIKKLPDVKIVGITTSEKETFRLIQAQKPHVLIYGFRINGIDCIEFNSTLKQKFPDVKLLITTIHNENWIIEKALKHKVEALVLKNKTNSDELHKALQNIRTGKKYFSPEIQITLFEPEQQEEQIPYLTPREKEIIKLICEDLNNKEVGKILKIEANTVETHKRNIFKKLHVNSKVGLVREAIRYGYYEL